mmetsp:Transcript_2812/g.7161  ORF Transcript_2812/g.7161 Transcript_2812/m.7161 type:complete len:306 (+) Transcript_2812:1759-2676(+)
MCFRYSSMVVAPMTWSSPRDSAGFKMLAASIAPPLSPPPPAPTSVWISSIIKITPPSACCASFTTFLRRSSNSPRYFVPERSIPRSSSTTRLPCNISGTSPTAILYARPSAMAVFPTPGSPISTGLFFWRRARIWMVRSSSAARPTSGSMDPSAAAFVKSRPNSSSVAALPSPLPPLCATETSGGSSFSWSSFWSSSGTFVGSTLSFSKIFTALPPSSLISARRMCAMSMAGELRRRASSTASASTRLAAGVNGISTETMPLPRPTMSSTVFRVSCTVMPSFRNTLAVMPELSCTTPTSSISVPT